jgi:glutaryl-CoA dehydrogenase
MDRKCNFADLIIWARDLDDGEVKGFIVEKDNPGYSVEKIKGKMALRIVQNGLITLKDCLVTEENRCRMPIHLKIQEKY